MVRNEEDSVSEANLGDVDARLAMIESRIARPLSGEQREQVRTRIARSIALGMAMRAYPLTNADEPEIVLVPFHGGNR